MNDNTVQESPFSEVTDIPEELAILSSGVEVIFPATISPLSSADPKTMQLIDDIAGANKMLGLFPLIATDQSPSRENFNTIGTAAIVVRLMKMQDGTIRALIQGTSRIRLKEITG